jgi:hypothetical protein
MFYIAVFSRFIFSSSCVSVLRWGGKTLLSWAPISPFTWGRKQIQFPKRRASYFLEYRPMDQSKKPVILCVMHHRQKPSGSARISQLEGQISAQSRYECV